MRIVVLIFFGLFLTASQGTNPYGLTTASIGDPVVSSAKGQAGTGVTPVKGIKNVFTLSFHGKNNYPFKKEDSDFDLAFEDGVGDKHYLKKVKEILPRVIDDFEPDFIFYLSGVDIMENDKLGKLSLSLDGCKERDKYVLNLCKSNSIPVQVSMGGGYSLELKNIIEAHSNTFRLAQEIFF